MNARRDTSPEVSAKPVNTHSLPDTRGRVSLHPIPECAADHRTAIPHRRGEHRSSAFAILRRSNGRTVLDPGRQVKKQTKNFLKKPYFLVVFNLEILPSQEYDLAG